MKIAKAIEDTQASNDAHNLPPMDALCQFWPVISIALNFVKIFTGSKADEKIDQVLEWGHTLCSKNF